MIKLNNFFWLLSRITSAVAIFGLLLIVSCSKDDEGTGGVSTVQFANEAQTVAENGTAATINISFDKAVRKDGTITIAVTPGANTTYGTHFTTSPNGTAGFFEIEVAKGQTSAQFTFTPNNNALLADDRIVTLTISDVSSAFEIGAKELTVITITDDEGPTRANFATNATSIAETLTAGQDVTINLTNAAPATGTITVSFTSTTATYTTNFTTEPAAVSGELEIPVTVGATSVTFKVKPVDDGSVNAERVITFTLAEATGGVEVGTTITGHTFTITDNETPSVAAFENADGSVSEGSTEGITIPVTLTPATNGTGTLVITFTGADYGDDFTTDPAAVGGQITLNVATSAATTSFKVIPVNNDGTAADKEVTFMLSESTGIVTLGTSSLTHKVTLQDDDAITTIAAVRAAFPGTTTEITSPVRIQGIVTSANPQTNANNIWVQDATGGIVVRLTTPNAGSFALGTEVNIQLNGGRYAEFSGLLQIENVVKEKVTIVSLLNALPTPEVITVAQLNSGAFEGKRVQINNVAFVEANGIATMSGTKVVSTGSATTNVRTETGAPHASSIQPYGFGTVIGLASENGGAAQIIPIVFADDVFASSPSGTIGVTSSFSNFGSVNTGEESASQSYTVQGTSLTQDVMITASAGFKVSLIETGTYGSTVTIPAASANLATTVYVKFAPSTGGAQTGTLVHKSLGAAAVTADVAGTGVGASPLQTLALWTFETSLPNSTGAVSANLTAESGTMAATSIATGVHLSASTVYSNPAGNGSAESFSANFWDTNDYYQFATNSTGFADIKISWDQTKSGTGPAAYALYYSTDGTNFTKHGDYTVIQGTWAAGTPIATTSFSYDLSSLPALNNQATLVFRLVHTGSGIPTTGTNRVDNVKVEGR